MLEEYIQKGIVEEKTLLDLLREGNEQVPQKTALIDPYRRVRYAELMHEALQCAAVFQENGLVRHDVSWGKTSAYASFPPQERD